MSYMLEALSVSVQASALDLSQNGIATLEFQDQTQTTLSCHHPTGGAPWGFVGVDSLKPSTEKIKLITQNGSLPKILFVFCVAEIVGIVSIVFFSSEHHCANPSIPIFELILHHFCLWGLPNMSTFLKLLPHVHAWAPQKTIKRLWFCLWFGAPQNHKRRLSKTINAASSC